jgi:Pyruvate/2-oxoacid:ferredoxin oxidoreductase delta subunit
MGESLLKKDFKSKDVERVRNLVKKDFSAKTTTGVGYEKQYEIHNEGDVWEEDGRTWTIKEGIKQNLTRLDKAKESLHLPLFCPECNNVMKKSNDKLFYIQYHRCFDCQVEFETELRIKGLWNDYEKHILNSDVDGVIHDFNIWIDEEINSSNESWITEAGDIEKWNGSSKDKLLQNKEETIKYLESLKK